jgi:hypothetical protein
MQGIEDATPEIIAVFGSAAARGRSAGTASGYFGDRLSRSDRENLLRMTGSVRAEGLVIQLAMRQLSLAKESQLVDFGELLKSRMGKMS